VASNSQAHEPREGWVRRREATSSENFLTGMYWMKHDLQILFILQILSHSFAHALPPNAAGNRLNAEQGRIQNAESKSVALVSKSTPTMRILNFPVASTALVVRARRTRLNCQNTPTYPKLKAARLCKPKLIDLNAERTIFGAGQNHLKDTLEVCGLHRHFTPTTNTSPAA
jgi:hypothetical protein